MKHLQTRIVQKHAQQDAWNNSELIPLNSELIVYDADSTHPFPRLKLGDGSTQAKYLPFLLSNPTFVGTQEEYDEAESLGMIPVGTIVIITDNEVSEDNSTNTTAKLGYAVLGQMVLG